MLRPSHPLTPLAAVVVATLCTGVLTAGVHTATGDPVVPRARPAAVELPATPQPSATPGAVPLAVEVPAPAPAAEDAGDPATWPNPRLAAQLVFSCVSRTDLGTAAAHAAAGLGGISVQGRPADGAALAAGLEGVRQAGPGGVSPLLASDEEGGRVQRLAGILGRLPSAAEMGAWPDERIEQTAHDYGVGMRGLGVRLALSPVADLGTGGYIAQTQRAFSADPARVASAAAAWTRGLERAGVLTSVKHWPGHGNAADSHAEAPTVPPLAALEGRDLLPFDAVLATGASIVMVGHLRSDGLTEPGVPATLSPNALRVLRERAGPATVILTDSLSMAASSAALGISPADAAARSLVAGADWAMVCADPFGSVAAVTGALDRGELPREQAVASARRVLALKERLGLLAVPLATAPPAGAVEVAESAAGTVRLAGAVADPDGGAPVVRTRVGDAVVAEVPSVDGRFDTVVAAEPGVRVCVEALNTGAGRSTVLGCAAR